MALKTKFRQITRDLRHRFLFQAYIVSYPKCGRTWLNSLLLHYVRRRYENIQEALPFEWAPAMARYTWYRAFPNICFTHDVVGQPKTPAQIQAAFDLGVYQTKPTVILVRDPRDVLVSHYYHAIKKTTKNHLSPDLTLSEFIRIEQYGVQAIIAFYNLWADLILQFEHIHFGRYEDLRADPQAAASSILRLLGVTAIEEPALAWAIEQTSFNQMQRREAARKGIAPDQINPDALRVRRGQVGGYTAELNPADVKYVSDQILRWLNPIYGYQEASIDRL